MRRLAGLSLCFALAYAPTCPAQGPPAAEEILRLVPGDMALCVVMQDLRGYSEKFVQSPWYRALTKSALYLALSSSAEFRHLEKFERELTKRLDTRWSQIRDDILGDAVVFAFRQGTGPDEEHGLLLLKARDPALLGRLIERINREQKNSGELKELVDVKYRGKQYVRRVERSTTHYYVHSGPFLALSSREEVIRHVLDLQAKEGKPAPVGQALQRARARDAFLTLWLNPRAFDVELREKSRAIDSVEAYGLKQFLAVWDRLDAVVVSFRPGRELELSFSVQAKTLTPEIERFFNQPNKSSELWQRFPENAVIAMTTQVDVAALADSLLLMAPPAVRKPVTDSLQGIFKQVLPSVGPDLGLCLAAAPDAQDFPHAIAAVAVKAGEKQVDQAILQALRLCVGFALLAYNANNPEAIRLLDAQQDKVTVHYLAQDKLFPRGLQPAFALKDGYLLLASSPEAIKRFQKGAGFIPPEGESLFLRISFAEAAKLLAAHRSRLTAFLAQHNRLPHNAADQMLDGIVSVISLFDRLSVSQRSGDGQITIMLRLSPAKVPD